MKQRRRFDFGTLPPIDGMDMFIRLDRSIGTSFAELGFMTETYERAQSALMFFFQTKEDDARWQNEARLRAGLNEFYSIEDAARRDFLHAAKTVEPPRIAESRNPLVHLMYVLRHINVHTHPMATRVQPITVISEFGGSTHEHSYGAIIVETISVRDLQRSREVIDYYDSGDLQRALDWLLQKQQTFGVSEVFRAGMNAYCSEILRSLE